ncbi:hypothetical protein EVAR_48027_1 [Eumeta japonica]|uniref:Uncharacterized protein n=1 Tax=Eumeta variegata TaxID=151549 RepID=A0A4C2ADN3_EUMVA|nr:hypothetical protein EVAR_48027_1 [Eumeta japonica]
MWQVESVQHSVLKVMIKTSYRYPTRNIYGDGGALFVRQLFILRTSVSVHENILACAECKTHMHRNQLTCDGVMSVYMSAGAKMSNLVYRIAFSCLLSVAMCIDDYVSNVISIKGILKEYAVVECPADAIHGPFVVNVRRLEKCKGSKASECADYECWQEAVNKHEVHYKINVSKNSVIRQFKVELSAVKNNSSKKMFNYMFDKPCQHFLLSSYVKSLFQVGDNCKLSKHNRNCKRDEARNRKLRLGRVRSTERYQERNRPWDQNYKQNRDRNRNRKRPVSKAGSGSKTGSELELLIPRQDSESRVGTYTFMLDVMKLSAEFFGTNFFYGTWQMKIYIADRNCNLFCQNVVSAFEKSTA